VDFWKMNLAEQNEYLKTENTYLRELHKQKYAHSKLIASWNTKDQREQQDLEKIQHICRIYNRKYGYRMVSMKLTQQWDPMNHKKVLRLMSKYYLLSKVRKRNPYKQIQYKTQQHSVAENILGRQFRWTSPLQKLWTDITYVKLQQAWCYLSIIKDMVSGEILSHSLSKNLSLWATLKSITLLKEKLWHAQWNNILIHSDQWWHYTHPSYQIQLKKLWIVQSMSRKWNCLDNAPTESFFGHFKDEIDIQNIRSFEELEKYIENYIFEYNNSRPQWNKKKMTPVQYRNHLLKNKN
jgi:transposase InsO family protein